MENADENTIPLQYLNNENPFAFCKDYHKNSINMPEKKKLLNALQRIQPHKINFKMPQKYLEKERFVLIEAAINNQKALLIKKGLSILGTLYHNNPEELFEKNLHNEEILDIALELKKYKLIYHQRKLRYKVYNALNHKLSESIEYKISAKDILEIDNLKDALVYCKLEDLYEKSE